MNRSSCTAAMVAALSDPQMRRKAKKIGEHGDKPARQLRLPFAKRKDNADGQTRPTLHH
jgi:hypothetical protein